MYTLTAIHSDPTESVLTEEFTAYEAAKARAIQLVNHRHKDARVYDSNDRLMYTRTYSLLHGFKEQENTDMNTYEVRYGFGRNMHSLAFATFEEAKLKVDRIVRQTQHDEASIWQNGKKIYKFWYNGMSFHASDMRTPAQQSRQRKILH